MIIDFSTNKKIEESKKILLKENKIYDEDIFILQHVSANNDGCKSIIKYGILNRKELLKHEDIDIIKKLKQSKSRYEMMQKKDNDINICAFLCAKANLHYDNNWNGFPEILNYYYQDKEKWDKYIITFKVKYKYIEHSGFFCDDDETIIKKMKKITYDSLKDCIVILNKSYNVQVSDIIDIQKYGYSN